MNYSRIETQNTMNLLKQKKYTYIQGLLPTLVYM